MRHSPTGIILMIKIEIFGLPGAGKSTLARSLHGKKFGGFVARSVESHDSLLYRLKPRALWREVLLVLFRMRHRDFYKFVSETISRFERETSSKLRNHFFLSAVLEQVSDQNQRNGKTMSVNSEGFVQRLLGLTVRVSEAERPRLAERFLQHIPVADLYVFLSVDIPTAQKRVAERHAINPLRTRERDLDTWKATVALVRAAATTRGFRVVELDGSSPIEVNLEKLAELVTTEIRIKSCSVEKG